MAESNTSREGPASLLDTLFGLYQLRRDIEMVQFQMMSAAFGERPAGDVGRPEGIVTDAAALGLDALAFRRLLGEYLGNPGDATAGSALMDSVQVRVNQLNAELSEVPATIDKARDWLRAVTRETTHGDTDYEAYVLLANELDASRVDRIASDWRESWRQHRKRNADPVFSGEAFWVSRDFNDLFDDMAHYRFYERFRLGEFDTLFQDVERRIGEGLLDTAGSLDPFGTFPGPNARARAAAQAIWLVSRAHRLPVVLADVVNLALRGLCHAQSIDGSWPSPIETDGQETPRSFMPDTIGTAASIISVFKLSTSEAQQAQATKAVDWLLQHQEPDGYWSAYGPYRLGNDVPVLSTALALEAIIRSGRANIRRAVDRAAQWLIEAQAAAGGWNERSLPNPLLSVTVLEAFELWESRHEALPQQLVLARDLLRRSERLAIEDSAESRQLAVVAAHAGIEAFLYVVLEQPEINVRVMEGSKTIGLRTAMNKLQQRYQEQRIIQPTEELPHRQGVDRLAYLRDEVVHKALRVSQGDIEGPLTTAYDFVSSIAHRTLDRDLLHL